MKPIVCKCCGKSYSDKTFIKDESLMPLYYISDIPISDWTIVLTGSKIIECFCSPVCANKNDKYVK